MSEPSETAEEQFVRQTLQGEGYVVRRIAAAPPANRADYSAGLGSDEHLIEVKTMVPPAKEMGPDGVAFWSINLGYRNTISSVLSHGQRQLVATPAPAGAFRIVWFVLSDVDWKAYANQVKATAYGVVDLIYDIRSGQAQSKPCYLFTFAEFKRSRDLDAVLISSFGEGRICLNPWSARGAAFQTTGLWKSHASVGAVSDPFGEEARGEAFVADFDGDRRDEAAMLEGVQRKYGHDRLIPFKPTQHQASAFSRR